MDIDNEGFLTLMAEGGAVREDLKCPAGEVGDDLRAGNESGRDMIVSIQLDLRNGMVHCS